MLNQTPAHRQNPDRASCRDVSITAPKMLMLSALLTLARTSFEVWTDMKLQDTFYLEVCLDCSDL